MANAADVIIVGAGLAGLVAAAELADARRRVIIVDQEPEASLGGQAFWSFGGLFLIGSPEQRRLGVHDSRDLALQDWLGAAGFDRAEDAWPRRWAEAYIDFAAGEKRSWLHAQGARFFPIVGWAERGGYLASGHGNSVPRFHVTWGTGPGVIEPFVRRVREAERTGLVAFAFRHRVTGLARTGGIVTGVHGEVLAPSAAARGVASSRQVVGEFTLGAQAVIVTTGGIGGNHDLVRRNWPARFGAPPARMLSGVPDHVDGQMLGIVQAAGGRVINADRMWHYPEGIENYAPVWSRHGIRILSGPSPLWLDARGRRLPIPLFPGFDALGALEEIVKSGFDYSWLLLNQRIIEKEFALSGSEQNPDLTGKSIRKVLGRVLPGAVGPVDAFKERGADFVVRRTLAELVAGMNALTGDGLIELGAVERDVVARDREIANGFGKDAQITAIRGARAYVGDRLIRVAKPHRLLDAAAGPLIAVRLHILTRKTLGGLETDLSGRVLGADGEPLSGVFAAGEVAGFGGGGMHGYRALEGTFLGGCLFWGEWPGERWLAGSAKNAHSRDFRRSSARIPWGEMAGSINSDPLDGDRRIPSDGDLTAVLTELGVRPGAAILDAACGIGTQALGLARRGYQVTASDVASAPVARARREANARGLSLAFGIADLRELSQVYEQSFDAIVACDNAIPHLLTDREIEQAFRECLECLAPGGVLLVSVRDYDAITRKTPDVRPYGVRSEGDVRYAAEQVWVWDGDRYDVTVRLTLETAGDRQVQELRSRYYAVGLKKLAALMTTAGFARVLRRDEHFFQPLLAAIAPGILR